ncbi:hypothetical protein ES703_105279 [subsurface metagenome]
MKNIIIILLLFISFVSFSQTNIETITLVEDYDVSGGDEDWSWYIGEGVITWAVYGYASGLTGTLDGTIKIKEAFIDSAPDSVYIDYHSMPEWVLNEANEPFAFEDNLFSGKWIRISFTKNNLTGGAISIILRLVKP